jgi:hypothetical protein
VAAYKCGLFLDCTKKNHAVEGNDDNILIQINSDVSITNKNGLRIFCVNICHMTSLLKEMILLPHK